MFRINGDKGFLAMQGDVPLVPLDLKIDLSSAKPGPNGKCVLAYGEVTGHAHVIDSPRARRTIDAEICKRVEEHLKRIGVLSKTAVDPVVSVLEIDGTEPVDLVHEEHAPHRIPPGKHVQLRQVEYRPGDVPRTVAD